MTPADAAWIAAGAVWLIGAFGGKPTQRRQSFGWLAGHALVLALAANLLLTRALRVGPLAWRFVPDSDVVHWIGEALQFAGLAFAVWARLQIGRNWSGDITLKKDHSLIRTGPYAMVRHPIYTGLSLAILGKAIEHGNVAGLLAFLLLFFECKRKSLVEERFMVEQFGGEYSVYRKDVKGVIPWVW